MTVKPFNADPRIRGDRPYAFAAVVLSTDADGFLTDATIEPRIRYAATPSGVTGENSGSLILDADGSGQPYIVNASGTAVSLGSLIAADGLDLNGASLILDADGDTSITADTDDQIDIALSGADDFRFTANTFTALSGSTIATNTIVETTAASGVTVDGVLLKDGGAVFADGASIEVDIVNEATADAGVTVEAVLLKDGDVHLVDSNILYFGTGDDIGMSWDGTSLKVTQAAPDSAIQLGVDGAGIDLILLGDTASAACTWDQSADALIFSGTAKLRLQTIADPGNAAAIPVTNSGSVAITTAAAETGTLADPTYMGQTLSLFCDTYAVGDRVITAASRINQAGNTIMTFGAVGDFIKLEAITIGGALKWQVVSNDGVALS